MFEDRLTDMLDMFEDRQADMRSEHVGGQTD